MLFDWRGGLELVYGENILTAFGKFNAEHAELKDDEPFRAFRIKLNLLNFKVLKVHYFDSAGGNWKPVTRKVFNGMQGLFQQPLMISEVNQLLSRVYSESAKAA